MDLQKILQTAYTDKQLHDELMRRRAVRREQRKADIETRVSCRNCKFRVKGYNSKSEYYPSLVCKQRPKTAMFNVTSGTPQQVYFSCGSRWTNNCELFRHKNINSNENSNS